MTLTCPTCEAMGKADHPRGQLYEHYGSCEFSAILWLVEPERKAQKVSVPLDTVCPEEAGRRLERLRIAEHARRVRLKNLTLAPRYLAPSLDWRSALQTCGPIFRGETYLYLCEIECVAVKVGISVNIRSRIAQHFAMARAHDRNLGRVWISPAHVEAEANELSLRSGAENEYLRRPMDELMAQVLTLPMTRYNGTIV